MLRGVQGFGLGSWRTKSPAQGTWGHRGSEAGSSSAARPSPRRDRAGKGRQAQAPPQKIASDLWGTVPQFPQVPRGDNAIATQAISKALGNQLPQSFVTGELEPWDTWFADNSPRLKAGV